MDSVSVTLESAEEAESKNADQEADKGQKNADPSDDIQDQIMDCISMLQIIKKNIHQLYIDSQNLRKLSLIETL